MKWFNKWFAKKCKEAWESVEQRKERNSSIGSADLLSVRDPMIHSPGVTFTVYRATGGYIIENRKYDTKHDRNDTGLHIVTDDKDLGYEIGKIITFESLRR